MMHCLAMHAAPGHATLARTVMTSAALAMYCTCSLARSSMAAPSSSACRLANTASMATATSTQSRNAPKARPRAASDASDCTCTCETKGG